MYREYDWTFNVYRPRIGDTFTSVNGMRSFESLDDAKQVLRWCNLRLGKKTDTRTWRIELLHEPTC
jgi:hypothetical protein